MNSISDERCNSLCQWFYDWKFIFDKVTQAAAHLGWQSGWTGPPAAWSCSTDTCQLIRASCSWPVASCREAAELRRQAAGQPTAKDSFWRVTPAGLALRLGDSAKSACLCLTHYWRYSPTSDYWLWSAKFILTTCSYKTNRLPVDWNCAEFSCELTYLLVPSFVSNGTC